MDASGQTPDFFTCILPPYHPGVPTAFQGGQARKHNPVLTYSRHNHITSHVEGVTRSTLGWMRGLDALAWQHPGPANVWRRALIHCRQVQVVM